MTRVVDGDTLRLGEERVRLIGIDTPERGECFADRATERLRELAGRRVRLVYDEERTDRYGRTLAYVFAGDVHVNAALLREGLAEPLVVRPNDRYADTFARLARRARGAGRGMWSACRGT